MESKFFAEARTFAPAPGDQLLQNLPRAETQQGYVVVAVCSALFLQHANSMMCQCANVAHWHIFKLAH